MDPNPDYDASDEVEYFFNWLPWALRGVYPPPGLPADLVQTGPRPHPVALPPLRSTSTRLPPAARIVHALNRSGV
ncbi:hypothetical protein BN979_04151 [Mycolicibacterium vulneris]|nr:hypothetical protein BST41_04945 [Mycolicibacterium porcinum]CDO31338.1 hypothetical protein BN979_04151 [Mycolicibacterium vulneris]